MLSWRVQNVIVTEWLEYQIQGIGFWWTFKLRCLAKFRFPLLEKTQPFINHFSTADAVAPFGARASAGTVKINWWWQLSQYITINLYINLAKHSAAFDNLEYLLTGQSTS